MLDSDSKQLDERVFGTGRFLRRAFLGGIAGVAFGASKAKKVSPQEVMTNTNVGEYDESGRLMPPKLILMDTKCNRLAQDAAGNPLTNGIIGRVISLPQVCSSDPYGTDEWIKEITFVDPATSDADAVAANLHLAVGNSPKTVGCGHVSKSVNVKRATKNNGVWSEQQYANNPYYCLVDQGRALSNGQFLASEIWITTQMWDSTTADYKAAKKLGKRNKTCRP